MFSTKPSHLFFALTRIVIGLIGFNTLYGFVGGRFMPILPPLPQSVAAHALLTYVSIIVSLVGGIGLLTRRAGAPAALLLLVYFVVWAILFKVPIIVRAPFEEVSYQNMGESLVLVAAAWVLYRELARTRNLLSGDVALRAAHILYGLALIAFGLSHFFYLGLTAPLVPNWLPDHEFWAYFTGSIYTATGLAIVLAIFARLAAALVAVQIALITLLVWGPMVLGGGMTTFHWQETIISCALTAGAWVLATSFGNQPWLYRPVPRRLLKV